MINKITQIGAGASEEVVPFLKQIQQGIASGIAPVSAFHEALGNTTHLKKAVGPVSGGNLLTLLTFAARRSNIRLLLIAVRYLEFDARHNGNLTRALGKTIQRLSALNATKASAKSAKEQLSHLSNRFKR